MSFCDSWEHAVQVSLFVLIAAMFVENRGPADPIKFLPKQVNSLCSTAKVFQLERCQWGRLSKNLDLEINELTDFSLVGSGWSCHHGASLNKFSRGRRSRHRDGSGFLPFLWKSRVASREATSAYPIHAFLAAKSHPDDSV
jgi:hypothetical protein